MVSTSNTNNYCPDGETEKYEIVHFYSHAPKLKNYLKRTLQRVWSQATILDRIKWNRKFASPESRMTPREVQNRLSCHLSLILGER